MQRITTKPREINIFMEHNVSFKGLPCLPHTGQVAGTGSSAGSAVSHSCVFGTEGKAACMGPRREQELNTTEHDFSAALTSIKPCARGGSQIKLPGALLPLRPLGQAAGNHTSSLVADS